MPLLVHRTAPPARRSVVEVVADRLTPSQLALGRTGAGTVMLLRPRALPQLLGVDSATATRLGWGVQMLGAREAALGLGTLLALRGRDPRAARPWLAAGALCDALDAVIVTGALLKGRVRVGSGAAAVAVAVGATVVGVRALEEDEDDI